MNSLTQEKVTFKQIERIFFEIGCEVARTLMQQFLEKVDRELAEIRNKAELRHKGLKTTNIKTLMGEVILRRAVYKKVNEDGGIEHRYLLDEALGLDTMAIYLLIWPRKYLNIAVKCHTGKWHKPYLI